MEPIKRALTSNANETHFCCCSVSASAKPTNGMKVHTQNDRQSLRCRKCFNWPFRTLFHTHAHFARALGALYTAPYHDVSMNNASRYQGTACTMRIRNIYISEKMLMWMCPGMALENKRRTKTTSRSKCEDKERAEDERIQSRRRIEQKMKKLSFAVFAQPS